MRIALDDSLTAQNEARDFPKLSAKNWECIYNEANRQTVLGVAFCGIQKLPTACKPPIEIMFQWASDFEVIGGANKILNDEAAKLTQFFDRHKMCSVILKGPANARLYPAPFSRQAGDIDIWVSGSKKKIIEFLEQNGLLHGNLQVTHHVHMKNERGIDVEVHLRPSSGNYNPFSSRRLLRFLNNEIKNPIKTPEGFNAHSLKFALAMQLSHIYRHLLGGGIGLRQIIDYYILLKNSSEQDRIEISKNLNRFGLKKIAGALMWLLHEHMGLNESLMLCAPDEFRGRWLLQDISHGGNFGRHVKGERLKWLYWWLGKRKRSLRFWRFDIVETFWLEINYWQTFLNNTSTRIRLRKISLRDERL